MASVPAVTGSPRDPGHHAQGREAARGTHLVRPRRRRLDRLHHRRQHLKGLGIRRTGKVALCVQDDQPPFSFVSVDGDATWSDDLDQLRYWAARLGGRYMGADRAEEYGARNAVPGELLIRVTPIHVAAERDIAD